MIPVDQTIFSDDEEGRRGNCWIACIASILERPLESVPHFVQIENEGGQHWFTHTWQWLLENGHRLVQHTWDSLPDDRPHMRCGKSPRSTEERYLGHAVVYVGEEMVHDPHPSRDGILDVDTLYTIEPTLAPIAGIVA